MSSRSIMDDDDMAMAVPKKNQDNLGDSGSVDMLSNLPEGVLDHILIKLPLIDAVRTSILSTHWRHKWVTISHLRFDFGIGNWDYASIVDHVLKSHKGPIVCFSVAKVIPSTVVDRCIRFLLDHPVEHLSIRLLDPPVYQAGSYSVFDDIYSFYNLKILHVYCFKLVPLPLEFKGFSKLVDVRLVCVDVEVEDLKTFLSRCPMLERLELGLKDANHRFLDIDVPRLKRFTFFGSFESICFGSAVLERIAIVHNGYSYAQPTFNEFELCDSCSSRSNLIRVFNQLPSIENGYFDGGFLEFLAIGGVPKRLPINLNHITILSFEDVGLDFMVHVTCILCLLRSCPNLKGLWVSVDKSYDDDEQSIQYLKAQQMCNNVSLGHLRCVWISISGFKAEMEFVKLILLWATSLERLILCPRRSEGADLSDKAAYKKLLREHNLLKRIARLPRASARATVIFQSDVKRASLNCFLGRVSGS